jgi:hypothetical protein
LEGAVEPAIKIARKSGWKRAFWPFFGDFQMGMQGSQTPTICQMNLGMNFRSKSSLKGGIFWNFSRYFCGN